MYGGGSASKLTAGALAGILAVGMVPAAAFAEEAAEVEEEAAVELQLAPAATNLVGATVTKAIDEATGEEVTVKNGKVTITADGKNHVITPTEITLSGDKEAIKIADAGDDVEVKYYKTTKPTFAAADGAATGTPLPVDGTDAATKDAGKYWVAVQPKSAGAYKVAENNGATNVIVVEVELVGAQIEDVVAYEGNDTSDTKFEYIGKALTINFKKADGTKLTSGTEYASVKYGAKGGVASSATTTAPTAPGDYVAYLCDQAAGAGNVIARAEFSVVPFDLSAAQVSTPDQQTAALPTASNVTINKLDITPSTGDNKDLGEQLKFEWVSGKSADGKELSSIEGPGTYTFKVLPKDDAAKAYVTGEKAFSFDVVTDNAISADFNYDGQTFTSIKGGSDNPLTLNPDRGQAWDESKLYITIDGIDYTPGKGLTVTYADDKGKTVTKDALKDGGNYVVTVKLDGAATDYAAAKSEQLKVTISRGVINSTDMSIYYDGKVKGGDFSVPYSGKNLLENFSAEVKAGSKKLVEGTDYRLKVTDKDNKEVTEIVDAGAYKVAIVSDTYTVDTDHNSLTFTVSKLEVTKLRIKGMESIEVPPVAPATTPTQETYHIPWSGNEITPVFEYETTEKDAKGNNVWAELPAEAYKLVVKQNSKAATLKDEGTYVLEITNGTSKNYTVKLDGSDAMTDVDDITGAVTIGDYPVFDKAPLTVAVADNRTFTDVVPGKWYYDVVEKANELGYMTGISGTKLFQPNAKLTRAQAIETIYKMANGAESVEGRTDNNSGYDTPFSDVASGAWYARSVQWGANMGIVKGYAGTDQFKPNATITRQEFAVMLYRYTEAKGESVATTGTSVDTYKDAKDIASWAKQAMAWAVDNKIMGNNPELKPADNIIRAEAAKMTTVAQPEKLAK